MSANINWCEKERRGVDVEDGKERLAPYGFIDFLIISMGKGEGHSADKGRLIPRHLVQMYQAKSKDQNSHCNALIIMVGHRMPLIAGFLWRRAKHLLHKFNKLTSRFYHLFNDLYATITSKYSEKTLSHCTGNVVYAVPLSQSVKLAFRFSWHLILY